ncbi:MAG: M23 family metallopeptidase [Candidatus Omnitrophica bacterium]|nr:M23 family metallopeptidase [Candidatus Omnitrophota bacterium]
MRGRPPIRPGALLMRIGAFWTVVALSCAATFIMLELPYVNWARVAAPVDAQPLIIRRDAKGDGRFGASRSGGRSHRGVDLAAPLESPVRAIRSGRVLEVGSDRGLGQYVALGHGWRLQSLYAHLKTIAVKEGARVKQGEVVGVVGKTGNARHPWITPHVHLEIWRDGAPVNPEAVGLAFAGVAAGAIAERRAGDSADASDTGGE